MAKKVLGQVAPAATTNTDLYTVPAGKSTVVSTLAVCNRTAGTITYRVAIRPASATLADEHYLLYDVSLTAASTDYHTVGITLAATDVVTVYSGNTGLTFSLFGDES